MSSGRGSNRRPLGDEGATSSLHRDLGEMSLTGTDNPAQSLNASPRASTSRNTPTANPSRQRPPTSRPPRSRSAQSLASGTSAQVEARPSPQAEARPSLQAEATPSVRLEHALKTFFKSSDPSRRDASGRVTERLHPAFDKPKVARLLFKLTPDLSVENLSRIQRLTEVLQEESDQLDYVMADISRWGSGPTYPDIDPQKMSSEQIKRRVQEAVAINATIKARSEENADMIVHQLMLDNLKELLTDVLPTTPRASQRQSQMTIIKCLVRMLDQEKARRRSRSGRLSSLSP